MGRPPGEVMSNVVERPLSMVMRSRPVHDLSEVSNEPQSCPIGCPGDSRGVMSPHITALPLTATHRAVKLCGGEISGNRLSEVAAAVDVAGRALGGFFLGFSLSGFWAGLFFGGGFCWGSPLSF